MIKKKLLSMTMVCMMVMTAVTGCGKKEANNQEQSQPTVTAAPTLAPTKAAEAQSTSTTAKKEETKTPKYVFLFIGDGMSYPQIQLTNYYVNAVANEQTEGTKVVVNDTEKTVLESKNRLTMMDFAVAGSAQTYDSTSFAPDSASTATSIATGKKTWSGSINVSTDFSTEYETIAEQLKDQKITRLELYQVLT